MVVDEEHHCEIRVALSSRRKQMRDETSETRVPIVEERATIDKRVGVTGSVRIKTEVDERVELLAEELTEHTVTVERVRVDREVDAPPPVRSEGDVLIIPIVEQRLVVAKRWVVTEELHVHRRAHTQSVSVPVELRATRVSVERDTDDPED
jgi:stress response protein YsnF